MEFIRRSPLVYLPIILLIIWAFLPVVSNEMNISEEGERQLLAQVPYLPPAQILEQMDELISSANSLNSVTEPPLEKVFAFTDQATLLELQLRKDTAIHGRWKNPNFESMFKSEARLGAVTNLRNELTHKAFSTALSSKRDAGAEQATWRKTHHFPVKPNLETNFGSIVVASYLKSIIAMTFFFTLRVQRRDVFPGIEIWRILPSAVFWPAAMFIYPQKIDPRRSLERALKFICYASSMMVSCFGGGLGVAKAQSTKDSGASTKSSNTEKSGKRRFSLGNTHIGAELYPLTTGNNPGPHASPWYATTSKISENIRVAHFGFVEVGTKKSDLFTNHVSNLHDARAPWIGLNTEVGGGYGFHFVHLGPRVNLTKTPGLEKPLSKIFSMLGIGYYNRISGPGMLREVVFYWGSKPIRLGKAGSLSLDGFYRFRPEKPPSVGQPHITWQPAKLKHIRFNLEASLAGRSATWRFGPEFVF